MEYANILTEVRGSGERRVGLVTLNRPKQLNALNDALMDDLAHALRAFDADDAIGCIVVTGSEKAFAAGADIAAMQPLDYMQTYKGNFISRNWEAMRDVRKPVIAAVAGFALGGGCELVMMCDFAIAADTAKFGQPEIKIGIFPGAGGTQRLPRAVSKAKAMDLVLTGRMMDAAEAERGARVTRRARGGADRDGHRCGRDDLRLQRSERDDGQGVRQSRVRVAARRGHPLRAALVPRRVRHARPEGRDGRVPRVAAAEVRAALSGP